MRRALNAFDYALFGLVLVIMTFGVLMIYSAQPAPEDGQMPFVTRQLIWIAIGLTGMLIASAIDYRLLGYFVRFFYVAIVVVLVVVLALGATSFGAQRWFSIMFFTIQPSELSKLVLILTLAHYLGNRPFDWQALLVSFILTAIPAGLIFLQPSLSVALSLFAIWAGMVFVAGLPWRYLVGAGVTAGAAIPFIWTQVLQEYQRRRVLIFLDPLADPLGEGYNLVQSRIAIGSGGLWGQGYMHGSQSQLGYLRVRHTDFIFTVVAEELGFVGAVLLIALFALLLWRLLGIAQRATDRYGRFIVVGVMFMIFFQVVVNIGVNVGLVPPTGVVLPLFSYGGSNLITMSIGLGLVQNVAMRYKRFTFE
nr:rod shape-determining protein RodA [Ardenticatena sp.]